MLLTEPASCFLVQPSVVEIALWGEELRSVTLGLQVCSASFVTGHNFVYSLPLVCKKARAALFNNRFLFKVSIWNFIHE